MTCKSNVSIRCWTPSYHHIFVESQKTEPPTERFMVANIKYCFQFKSGVMNIVKILQWREVMDSPEMLQPVGYIPLS